MPAPNGSHRQAHAREASMGYAELARGAARFLESAEQVCGCKHLSEGDAV